MNTSAPINNGASPGDDEIAAVLVAIQTVLAAEQAAQALAAGTADRSRWHESAKLVVQSLQPLRTSVPPRWSTIECLRRSTGGAYGVTGL